jgi:hypothetical protein
MVGKMSYAANKQAKNKSRQYNNAETTTK